MKGKSLTSEVIDRALLAHEDWVLSGGAKGLRADFTGCNLSGKNLRGRNLTGALFKRSRLVWTDLSEANLTDTHFEGAYLNHADLSGANCTSSNFKNAVLCHASLHQTCFDKADLRHVDFRGTSLENEYCSFETALDDLSALKRHTSELIWHLGHLVYLGIGYLWEKGKRHAFRLYLKGLRQS